MSASLLTQTTAEEKQQLNYKFLNHFLISKKMNCKVK